MDTDYTIITLKEEQQKGRKWFMGPFVTEDLSRFSQFIEIGYTELQAVDESEHLHFHSTVEEYYMLLRGHMRIQVGTEAVHVKAGQILLIRPNVPHSILQVRSGTRILLIKTPPGAADKTIVTGTQEEQSYGEA